MAKRFIDTNIFRSRFFQSLDTEMKLLWIYILNDCDHAGVWKIDFEVAEIRLKIKIDPKKASNTFDKKIKLFDEESKWFIPSFIDFQYGEIDSLNPKNNAHKAVLRLLYKYFKEDLISPSSGAMDKDKDKDKDKGGAGGKNNYGQEKLEVYKPSFFEESTIRAFIWIDEPYLEPILAWQAYKVHRGEGFSYEPQLKSLLKHLKKISRGIPELAKNYVEESMRKRYKDVYVVEDKDSQNGNNSQSGKVSFSEEKGKTVHITTEVFGDLPASFRKNPEKK